MRNQIVILAAGKGTRMGNSRVPKVLTMLRSRPLILYVLEEIGKINQLIKPVVVVGFGADRVKGVLGDDYFYAYQGEQLGTAHALLAAKGKVKSENILVLYGDMPFIKAESLKRLIQLHFKTQGNISMFTCKAKTFRGVNESLANYGRVIRDSHHAISGIVEHKDASSHQKKIMEVNPGIYMFKSGWLWDNLKKIQNKNAQQEYYLTDIVRVAIGQGQKIQSLPITPQEVIGVNSKQDLVIAESLLRG